jgi:S1/P1 Nuclease
MAGRMEMLRVTAWMALALAAGASAKPAWAWGCDGHQTVALVAERHLSPAAKAMVFDLLNSNPVDPTLDRYCKDQGPDAMTNASTWADDERSKDPSTGGWHFIDIPRGAKRSEMSGFCLQPDSCVTQALQAQMAILKDSAQPSTARATALRFIIHFVGDIHQPLHCSTNNDRGATCVPVIFFGTPPKLSEKNPASEQYNPNLHSTWDTYLIQTQMQDQKFANVQQFADHLDQEFQRRIEAWQKAGIDIDAWAWESHEAAERIAYGKLPEKIAIEKPIMPPIASCADDNDVAKRMLNLNIDLEQPYETATMPLIEEQLELAGVRLAMILNQLAP